MDNSDNRSPRTTPRKTRGPLIFGLIVLAVAIGIAVGGIMDREKAGANLVEATNEAAVAAVAVIQPVPNEHADELVLPGDVESWYEAPIFARVNGYVKM